MNCTKIKTHSNIQVRAKYKRLATFKETDSRTVKLQVLEDSAPVVPENKVENRGPRNSYSFTLYNNTYNNDVLILKANNFFECTLYETVTGFLGTDSYFVL